MFIEIGQRLFLFAQQQFTLKMQPKNCDIKPLTPRPAPEAGLRSVVVTAQRPN